MDSENKFWVWIWALIFTTICVITVSLCVAYVEVTKTFAENGYIEKPIPGLRTPAWQK